MERRHSSFSLWLVHVRKFNHENVPWQGKIVFSMFQVILISNSYNFGQVIPQYTPYILAYILLLENFLFGKFYKINRLTDTLKKGVTRVVQNKEHSSFKPIEATKFQPWQGKVVSPIWYPRFIKCFNLPSWNWSFLWSWCSYLCWCYIGGLDQSRWPVGLTGTTHHIRRD